ncbi:MAG: hypothetical protein JWQ75_2416 [Pseudarthrobacter sp.]|nr:hypothetical protein [Pseudarthrobacter sp.]
MEPATVPSVDVVAPRLTGNRIAVGVRDDAGHQTVALRGMRDGLNLED